MASEDLRFVAHIDVLGMSSLVEKNLDDAWGMLSDLVAERDKLGKLGLEWTETNEHVYAKDIIYPVTFSDTIILFTKGDTDLELKSLIILVNEIFHKALCRCVPIRVGIACDKFYFELNKSMYVGPALIEAYRIGEAAQWLGIVLSDSVTIRAKPLDLKSQDRKLVVDWEVPTKFGARHHGVVNWPAATQSDLKVEPPVTIQQFYQAFESPFGDFGNLPPEIKSKYENTVHFMNSQLVNAKCA